MRAVCTESGGESREGSGSEMIEPYFYWNNKFEDVGYKIIIETSHFHVFLF
jgi:hypothetical protein